MDNIYEILESVGIKIPEDKKEEFNKKILENYKTINEVENLKNKLQKTEEERDSYKTKYDADIKQRDADLKDLQGKLKNPEADADKLQTLETELSTLQENYEKSKSEYEKQLAAQAYEFAVKEKASTLKFSSQSAKKAFIADALKEEMKLKDGELQGFDGFLESYKKNDADAFLNEGNKTDEQEDNKPKPQFSGKSTGAENEPKPAEKSSVTFW